MSSEAIINGEFSDADFSFDLMAVIKNLDTMLPVFSSDEAINNKVFKDALDSHRKLFEAQKSLCNLDSEEAEKVWSACWECYENVDSGEYPEEAWANALSFFFYLLITIKGAEVMAKRKYLQENYPVLIEKWKDQNPKMKEQFEEMENSFEPEDVTMFQDMVQDPEFDHELNVLLRHLYRNPDWADLADYYICLQYVYGAVDNHFSEQQNSEFGFDLMGKLRSVRNKYARNFLALMN